MRKFRTIEFYKDYFNEFFTTLPIKVQQKFVWTFELIENVERIPDTYLRHIEKDLYEIRVKLGSNIYRAFTFFDGKKMIVIMNGFIKKTQKTPKREIERALKIKREYEKEK